MTTTQTETESARPLVIVSADGHCGAKPASYRPYLERRWWPQLAELEEEDREWSSLPIWRDPDAETLAVIDPDGAIPSGGRTGAWDFERRLAELDRDGIAAETLGQGTQLASPLWFGEENLRAYPAELRTAGHRAHHRWVADAIASSGGRFLGFADPGPCLDLTETVGDLAWLRQHGFVAVGLPGILADPALPPLYDPYHEPFWSACADLGLHLYVHAGYGVTQGTFFETTDPTRPHDDDLGGLAKRVMFVTRQRRVFWQLLLGGVFDRHPSLKLVFTELRSYWVKPLLDHLDQWMDRSGAGLARRPSEYFAEHCFVTPSAIRRLEVQGRHDVGVDRLMFGADFPHVESTWPNTRDWIRATFDGVPEPEARRILGENAVDLFGFDRPRLEQVASTVGPRPADVLGSHAVDPRLVAHFDVRSGFHKPPDPPLDGWGLDEMLAADLASRAVR